MITADEINGIDRVEQLMAADADEYGSPFQSLVPAPSSALPTGGVLATTATNTAAGRPRNPDPAAAGHQAPRTSPAAPPSGRRQTGSPSFAPQGPKAHWTNADDRRLIHLLMDEHPALSVKEVALRLDRTPSAVAARRRQVRKMPCPFFVVVERAKGGKWYCDQGNGGHDGTCCGDLLEADFIARGGNAR